jgi:hypothetical protein
VRDKLLQENSRSSVNSDKEAHKLANDKHLKKAESRIPTFSRNVSFSGIDDEIDKPKQRANIKLQPDEFNGVKDKSLLGNPMDFNREASFSKKVSFSGRQMDTEESTKYRISSNANLLEDAVLGSSVEVNAGSSDFGEHSLLNPKLAQPVISRQVSFSGVNEDIDKAKHRVNTKLQSDVVFSQPDEFNGVKDKSLLGNPMDFNREASFSKKVSFIGRQMETEESTKYRISSNANLLEDAVLGSSVEVNAGSSDFGEHSLLNPQLGQPVISRQVSISGVNEDIDKPTQKTNSEGDLQPKVIFTASNESDDAADVSRLDKSIHESSFSKKVSFSGKQIETDESTKYRISSVADLVPDLVKPGSDSEIIPNSEHEEIGSDAHSTELNDGNISNSISMGEAVDLVETKARLTDIDDVEASNIHSVPSMPEISKNIKQVLPNSLAGSSQANSVNESNSILVKGSISLQSDQSNSPSAVNLKSSMSMKKERSSSLIAGFKNMFMDSKSSLASKKVQFNDPHNKNNAGIVQSTSYGKSVSKKAIGESSDEKQKVNLKKENGKSKSTKNPVAQMDSVQTNDKTCFRSPTESLNTSEVLNDGTEQSNIVDREDIGLNDKKQENIHLIEEENDTEESTSFSNSRIKGGFQLEKVDESLVSSGEEEQETGSNEFEPTNTLGSKTKNAFTDLEHDENFENGTYFTNKSPKLSNQYLHGTDSSLQDDSFVPNGNKENKRGSIALRTSEVKKSTQNLDSSNQNPLRPTLKKQDSFGQGISLTPIKINERRASLTPKVVSFFANSGVQNLGGSLNFGGTENNGKPASIQHLHQQQNDFVGKRSSTVSFEKAASLHSDNEPVVEEKESDSDDSSDVDMNLMKSVESISRQVLQRSSNSLYSTNSSGGALKSRDLQEGLFFKLKHMKKLLIALIINFLCLFYLTYMWVNGGADLQFGGQTLVYTTGVFIEIIMHISHIASSSAFEAGLVVYFGHLLARKEGCTLVICGFVQGHSWERVRFGHNLSFKCKQRKMLIYLGLVEIVHALTILLAFFTPTQFRTELRRVDSNILPCLQYSADDLPIDRGFPTITQAFGTSERSFESAFGLLRSGDDSLDYTTFAMSPQALESTVDGSFIFGPGITHRISTKCRCSTDMIEDLLNAEVGPQFTEYFSENIRTYFAEIGMINSVEFDGDKILISTAITGTAMCGSKENIVSPVSVCKTTISHARNSTLSVLYMSDGRSNLAVPKKVSIKSEGSSISIEPMYRGFLSLMEERSTLLLPSLYPGALNPLVGYSSPNMQALSPALLEAGMESTFSVISKLVIQRTYRTKGVMCQQSVFSETDVHINISSLGFITGMLFAVIELSFTLFSVGFYYFWLVAEYPIYPAILLVESSIYFTAMLGKSRFVKGLEEGVFKSISAEIWYQLDSTARIGESIYTLEDPDYGDIILDKPKLVSHLTKTKSYL